MAFTWEEKWKILCSLAGEFGVYISTDVDNQWYVHLSYVEIKEGDFLTSATGRGSNPILAIEKTFNLYTTLPLSKTIVLHAGDKEKRRCVRWNGFMWEDRKVE